MKEFRVLSPTAILGYGFPEESFNKGMELKPHVIAVDAGSTDPGPYYLGSGKSFTDRNAVKRDLAYMIKAGIENKIPVIVGTAGGSGADEHLHWCVEIVREISAEYNLKFKLGVLSSEISKEKVIAKLKEGKIVGLENTPELTEEEILLSERIVSQMGIEPYIKALEEGAEVLIGGRTYDPAVFSCLAVKNGFDEGLATHMGKILECAAIASTPGSGSDCMFGTLRDDHFELETLSPVRKCTPLSVAAHTLYEKTNPYILPGPGGILNLEKTTFEQNKENSVIVKGSRHIPTDDSKYFVKLEGAKKIGYRTVSIAATVDPILIAQLDTVVKEVTAKVKSNFEKQNLGEFNLEFKVYGQNAVMGIFNDAPKFHSSEVCIVIEAVGSTEEISATICSFARSTMLHFGYEGRKSTAGNLAFPFSPSDFKAGAVYVFNIYHLMEVDNPICEFDIQVKTLENGVM